MPKMRSPLRIRAYGVRWRGLAVWSGLLLAIGCNERDRLTFPTPSDGVGPVTTIDQPNGADTTVFPGSRPSSSTAGPSIRMGWTPSISLSSAGTRTFTPFHPEPREHTVTFALPVTTFGHSGETFVVQIYGVDALGNQGGTSTRQIHIR